MKLKYTISFLTLTTLFAIVPVSANIDNSDKNIIEYNDSSITESVGGMEYAFGTLYDMFNAIWHSMSNAIWQRDNCEAKDANDKRIDLENVRSAGAKIAQLDEEVLAMYSDLSHLPKELSGNLQNISGYEKIFAVKKLFKHAHDIFAQIRVLYDSVRNNPTVVQLGIYNKLLGEEEKRHEKIIDYFRKMEEWFKEAITIAALEIEVLEEMREVVQLEDQCTFIRSEINRLLNELREDNPEDKNTLTEPELLVTQLLEGTSGFLVLTCNKFDKLIAMQKHFISDREIRARRNALIDSFSNNPQVIRLGLNISLKEREAMKKSDNDFRNYEDNVKKAFAPFLEMDLEESYQNCVKGTEKASPINSK